MDKNTSKTSKDEGFSSFVLMSQGYHVGKTIGIGTYATVKVAFSRRHHCNVAIKIVLKATNPQDYLQKFLPREVDAMKGLKHPNITRFLHAIETTRRVYIIMEFAENSSLIHLIKHHTSIEELQSKIWFTQLLDAVEYCHSKGIVHRDIKCDNMLLDKMMNVKLSDFGFAKANLTANSLALSETFCGSYAYASPEILRGIPYNPVFSDIWSMGVVLFAMVFGKLPFDDSNHFKLLKQVQSKVNFPKNPKVSTVCKNLISKILAPLKFRVHLIDIKKDPWMTTHDRCSISDYRVQDGQVRVSGVTKVDDSRMIELVKTDDARMVEIGKTSNVINLAGADNQI